MLKQQRLLICFWVVGLCLSSNILFAQNAPVLVSDFNVGSDAGINQFNTNGVVLNNALLLPINDGASGEELGVLTNGNLSLLKDIHPNGDAMPNFLTLFKDKVYFVAYDDSNGGAIWQSDGTANGTSLFFDPDTNDNSTIRPEGLIVSQSDHLYFTHNEVLYRTDGQTTNQVATAVTFNKESNLDSPRYCTYEDGVAYLVHDANYDILSIYAATDTPTLLAELQNVSRFDDRYGMTEIANGLMFSLDAGSDGGLFVYDKTTMTLDRLAVEGDFPTARIAVALDTEKQFTYLPGKGFYSFTGNPSETEELLDISYSINLGASYPHAFIGDQLIFHAEEVFAGGDNIAVTDGTANGTQILFETNKGNISNMIANDEFVFIADGAVNSSTSEIYIYNPITNSEEVISTFDGNNLKDIKLIALLDGQLYFAANIDSSIGYEMYSVDISALYTSQKIINDNPVEVLLTDNSMELIAPELDKKILVEMYDIAGKKIDSFTTQTNTRVDITYPNSMNILVFKMDHHVFSRKYIRH